ncbi:HS12B-like protein [Mya arenaria]|uniref:HS12B-like protein n=1 Tax=Mya arenaria TaxID=6604 RepID=A0ABY7E061_MYAAR|nr:heat shock 70 kDa protein 12B-like [Mya arenaria]WAR02232.1 HS12B-like protein [Mya arenaria]
MELSVIRNPDLVVAIDVGSTYSGYAWQWRSGFKANKANVEFNTIWGQGAPPLHKTNTALLLKRTTESTEETSAENPAEKKTEIVAFGYSAERRWANICGDPDLKKDRDSYHLYKKFKLQLYQLEQNQTERAEIEDADGRRDPLEEIMTLFIQALREDFLKRLKKREITLEDEQILWVVTVPAIWSEKAKKFMRDAAEKSGIGKRNLLLASEPEAAAIYCLNLPSEQKSAMHNAFMPGHRFLTVDLGGGTADLSAVEVLGDGSLKELCNVQGQLVGGQNVNEAFLQSCSENFEGDVWKKCFMDANPLDLLEMEHDFEKMKVAIGSEDPVDELITVPLPETVMEGITTKSIKLSPKQDKGFEAKCNKLQFRSKYIRDSLFKQTCHLIFDAVDRVLQKRESSGIQAVVLVGGFAESSIVQENVRTMIQTKYSNVKVVAPTSPFKAVLMGAVMYGHDMFIYKSRISRATYGVGCKTIFDEKKHDQSKNWYNEDDGKYYCKDIFDVHVRMGDSVFLNDKSTIGRTYLPLLKNQKILSLPLYETSSHCIEKEAVLYTTDGSAKKVGEIKVELPESEDSTKQEVCVQMIYGGTQLSVIAKEKGSGKEYNAEIKFDTV